MAEEDVLEFLRPAEFGNDHDWAQELAFDVMILKEKLSVATGALEVIRANVSDWDEYLKEANDD